MHDKRTDLDVSRPIARQTARRALAHVEIGAAQARPESAPRRAAGSTSGPKGWSPGDLVKNSALQPRRRSIRTRWHRGCNNQASACNVHRASQSRAG